MTTGEKIRYRRLELNMTMEDLGRAVGVQRSAINKYEKGLVDITSSKLKAIANALNVSPVSLMADEPLLDDFDNRLVSSIESIPRSQEARIISGGIDRMPPEKREQAIKVLQAIFADYFDGGEKNDT